MFSFSLPGFSIYFDDFHDKRMHSRSLMETWIIVRYENAGGRGHYPENAVVEFLGKLHAQKGVELFPPVVEEVGEVGAIEEAALQRL